MSCLLARSITHTDPDVAMHGKIGATDSKSDLVVLPVQVDRVHGHNVLHREEKDVTAVLPARVPPFDDAAVLVGRRSLRAGRLCPQRSHGQLLRPCRHVLLLRSDGDWTSDEALLVVEEVPDDLAAGRSILFSILFFTLIISERKTLTSCETKNNPSILMHTFSPATLTGPEPSSFLIRDAGHTDPIHGWRRAGTERHPDRLSLHAVDAVRLCRLCLLLHPAVRQILPQRVLQTGLQSDPH